MAKNIRHEVTELTEEIDIQIETLDAQIGISCPNRAEVAEVIGELETLQSINKRLRAILKNCE